MFDSIPKYFLISLNLVFLDDVLHVHEDDPDQLDEGDDEGAKGRGPEVVTQQSPAGSQDGVETNTALVSTGGERLSRYHTDY